jgi:hypothetical protein
MTSSKRPKVRTPEAPAPTPEPVMGREEEEAKKKVRKRRGGRESNILAGRLTSQRNDILKTQLG